MVKIEFNCTHFQAKLKVPEHLAGVSGPCPKCGGTIEAPQASGLTDLEFSPPPFPAKK